MENDGDFMRVPGYQRLEHSSEQQGFIKSGHSNIINIIMAIFAGCIVGSLLPW